MKRVLSAVLIISCLLCFAGCSKETTVISDINEYDAIWTLQERKVSGSSFLFPTSVDKNDVLGFSCEHTYSMLNGAVWQVILELSYEADEFTAETDKIKALCKGSPIYGENGYFDTAVYASVWNQNGCYEYAVTNAEANQITYIYLQQKDKDEITLDSKYIPKEYKVEMNTAEFSIY